VINKKPNAGAFEEGNAPAIFVFVGATATSREASKAEHDISRHVAIHAE
jgi:hypothetical protein